MFLHFDRQRMELQVVCAATESYSPNEKIEEVNGLIKELKSKIEQFTIAEVNPLMKEIEEKLQAENQKLNPQE